VLRREDGDLTDECRPLQLWASMLKETTVTERAEARGRQRGFDLQAEAIELRDADSRRALADAQELYTSVEARAAVIIKQEEDLAARTCQVNQRVREVEELERRLLEREELDGITLRRELEALGTRESGLDRREAELDREREGLKDARVQILARELDADAREAGLRD
jgi:predicted  nucleic acid-binding Zn-ribbon protein